MTQFDFTVYVPPEIPWWLKSTSQFFEWIAPAAPYIFWAVVALGIAAILWVIWREARGIKFRWPWAEKKEPANEDLWEPDQQAAQLLLGDAEALAAAGRYAEAARLLLRRSIEDIATRRPEFLRPSLTARDIAAAPALPDAARRAFAAIARVVEVSAFGNAAVNADAWMQCRAAYGDFALAGSWRG